MLSRSLSASDPEAALVDRMLRFTRFNRRSNIARPRHGLADRTRENPATDPPSASRSQPCPEIVGHHYRRTLASSVFFAGELLDLEAVPLKAPRPILLRSIAALDFIESFTAYPKQRE